MEINEVTPLEAFRMQLAEIINDFQESTGCIVVGIVPVFASGGKKPVYYKIELADPKT